MNQKWMASDKTGQMPEADNRVGFTIKQTSKQTNKKPKPKQQP